MQLKRKSGEKGTWTVYSESHNGQTNLLMLAGSRLGMIQIQYNP